MDILEANKNEHLDKIIQFQVAMAKETENLDLDQSLVFKGVSAVFDDSTKGHYYIAREDNQIIGSLLIIPEWSDWRNAQVWWIHSVYIIPERRGQGVFKKMYTSLKNRVLESSELAGLRLYVDKTNIPAQKVYNAIGMSNQHYDLYEWLK